MKHIFTCLTATLLLGFTSATFANVGGMNITLSDSGQTTSSGSTGKPPKDGQNQLQYLQPDLNQTNYNLRDRIQINKPQMPKYDVADTTPYFSTSKKRKQQNAFMNHKYYYPAKPKNQWEIGFGLGSFILSGDVAPQASPLKSYGATFTVRKSFGYVFSMRFQYVYGQAEGLDWKPKYNSYRNPVLNGGLHPGVIDYVHHAPGGNEVIFPNYRMRAHEVSLEAVLTLGNIKFHRERSMVNFYTFLGVGAIIYNTKTNVLDANNKMYNFQTAVDAYDNTSASGSFLSNPKHKAVTSALKALMDNTYETDAESHSNTEKDRGVIGKMTLTPVYSLGFGIGIHASKRVTVNLESRVSFTHDDLMDGQQYQEDFNKGGGGGSLTPGFDNLFYNAVTVNIHLGKKSLEPLWWLNPMDYTYKKLAEMDPNAILDDLLKDDDEDGVINKMDKEPNTKKGCPVDTHGVALDSDHDGIIDCDDAEPFSQPGFPIDASGKAKVPCCAENMPINPNSSSHNTTVDCSKGELPEIHFADDKYGIMPEYFAHLQLVSDKMQMCPDAKIVVTGFNTDGKYGEQLAWNRVNKAIEYLSNKYGIDRSRFMVKFVQLPKNATAQEKADARKVEFRVAQDGENFPNNPPSPHPGLKAGSER